MTQIAEIQFNADVTKGRGPAKRADPFTESVLPLNTPVLNMLRTIGAGKAMSRKDLQETLKVCDKSLRRYIGQALKCRCIQVEGRGPEQRIRVIEVPDKLDKPDCPDVSTSPNAGNRTGETIMDHGQVLMQSPAEG